MSHLLNLAIQLRTFLVTRHKNTELFTLAHTQIIERLVPESGRPPSLEQSEQRRCRLR
jgi:hypothetical protein